jgi:hypothetical protein
MLRGLWARLTGASREEAIRREEDRERDSPSERRHIGESIDDLQADASTGEHLGGVTEDQLFGEGRRED